MVKKIIIASILIFAAAIMQSTILSRLTVYIHAVPDLALCILVYSAYVNGFMPGYITGFFSGLLLDFFSAAPLGLNAFVRTLLGGICGFIKDTFYLDIIFLPMALCAGATILKALIFSLLHLLFPESIPSYLSSHILQSSNLTFLFELGMNTLSAPLLFGLLKLLKPLSAK
jgi:rod shape-determining protein MreD